MVLLTSQAAKAMMTTMSTIWMIRPRVFGSRISATRSLGSSMAWLSIVIGSAVHSGRERLRKAATSACSSTRAAQGAAPVKLFSADRGSVLQPALGPERVQSTLYLERGIRPDVTIEDLAIVSDRRDHLHHPVVGEAHIGAEIAVLAEKAAHIRIFGIDHLFDIGLGHAQFLGIDRAEMHPFDDVEPLLVTLAHQRPQRLL